MLIKSEIKGIPCLIKVWSYIPYYSAYISPDPWNSHSSEGGYGEWEVLDANGRKNKYLESLLGEEEIEQIETRVMMYMEGWDV